MSLSILGWRNLELHLIQLETCCHPEKVQHFLITTKFYRAHGKLIQRFCEHLLNYISLSHSMKIKEKYTLHGLQHIFQQCCQHLMNNVTPLQLNLQGAWMQTFHTMQKQMLCILMKGWHCKELR